MIPAILLTSSRVMRKLWTLSLLLAAATCGAAPPEAVTGRVEVTDGDSFEIGATRIRLNAVDAPEGRQTCVRNGMIWQCGDAAAAKLRSLVAGREVVCTRKDTDSYGRMVAVCRSGSTDLGAEMVSAGLALAYRQYGNDYVAEENAARAARRGLWAGEFTPPWEYRRSQRGGSTDPRSQQSNPPAPPRSTAAPVPAQSAKCSIKGNINREGERIYHVPGSPSYDETRIDPSNGERWFCSEVDARAAGWRAPHGR
jgi:endonuclease YncB( thermonuclease family)